MDTESITSKFAVGGIDTARQRIPATVVVAHAGGQESAALRQDSVVERAQVSREEIDNVVSELEDFAQTMQRDLNFHVDNDTGHVVIQVIDVSTDKVVRQIPEEEVLVLARRLEGMLDNIPKGVLIEGEA